jgi:uncharacterized membrane protein YhaH (DUF805 family)
MGFMDAVRSGFGNYVTFSGRARRSEYWFWALFVIIAFVVAIAIDGWINPDLVTTTSGNGSYGVSAAGGIVTGIVSLGLFLPGLAMTIRRLHDIDRSGWWILIGLIPFVGFIVLIVFYCTDGTKGPNRFGEDAKGR